MPPQPTFDRQTEPQFSSLWTEIRDELQRALTQFPPFHSGHEGWAMVQEEVDELWEAVKMNQRVPARYHRMRGEAIQVAAMAIRFLLEMDQFKN